MIHYGFETGEYIDIPDIESEQGIQTQNVKAYIEIGHCLNNQQKQTKKSETNVLENNRDVIKNNGPCIDELEKQKATNINIINPFTELQKLKIKLENKYDDNDKWPTQKKRKLLIESELNLYSTGCSWDSLNWSCAYDSIIMGLYSLYNNTNISCQQEWSTQSTLTHFLSERFNYIQANSSRNLKDNQFNILHNDFRNKLTSINPVKFPRFGTALVAIDEIISVL